jgi:hypothetical protein
LFANVSRATRKERWLELAVMGAKPRHALERDDGQTKPWRTALAWTAGGGCPYERLADSLFIATRPGVEELRGIHRA